MSKPKTKSPAKGKEKSPEKESENFFERVNARLEKMGGAEALDEKRLDKVVEEEGKKERWGIADKVIDAFKNPKAAIKYIFATSLSFLLPGPLKEFFGIKKKAEEALEGTKNKAEELIGAAKEQIAGVAGLVADAVGLDKKELKESYGNAMKMMEKFLPTSVINSLAGLVGTMGLLKVVKLFRGEGSPSLIGSTIDLINPFRSFTKLAGATIIGLVAWQYFGNESKDQLTQGKLKEALDKEGITDSLVPGGISSAINAFLNPLDGLKQEFEQMTSGIKERGEDSKKWHDSLSVSKKTHEKQESSSEFETQLWMGKGGEIDRIKSYSNYINSMSESSGVYITQLWSYLSDDVFQGSGKGSYKDKFLKEAGKRNSEYFDPLIKKNSKLLALIEAIASGEKDFSQNKEDLLNLHEQVVDEMESLNDSVEYSRQRGEDGEFSIRKLGKGLFEIPFLTWSLLINASDGISGVEIGLATGGLLATYAGIRSAGRGMIGTRTARKYMSIATLGTSELGLKLGKFTVVDQIDRLLYGPKKAIANFRRTVMEKRKLGVNYAVKTGSLGLLDPKGQIHYSKKEIDFYMDGLSKGYFKYGEIPGIIKADQIALDGLLIKLFRKNMGLNDKSVNTMIDNGKVMGFLKGNTGNNYLNFLYKGRFLDIYKVDADDFIKFLDEQSNKSSPNVFDYLKDDDVVKHFNSRPGEFRKLFVKNGLMDFLSAQYSYIKPVKTAAIDKKVDVEHAIKKSGRIAGGLAAGSSVASKSPEEIKVVVEKLDADIAIKKAKLDSLKSEHVPGGRSKLKERREKKIKIEKAASETRRQLSELEAKKKSLIEVASQESVALTKEAAGEAVKDVDYTSRLKQLESELKNPNLTHEAKIEKLKEVDFINGYRGTSGSSFDIKAFNALDKAGQAKEIEVYARKLESIDRGVNLRVSQEIAQIQADARKAGKALSDPDIIARLERVDINIIAKHSLERSEGLRVLTSKYNELPKEYKTPDLRAQILAAREGAQGSFVTRLKKGATGRFKMMCFMAAAIAVVDQITKPENSPEQELNEILADMGPMTLQLFIDIIPGLGTYSNFHSAIAGENLIDKKTDVSSGTSRVINGLFGIVGLAADALTVITMAPSLGSSFGANVMIRLTRIAAKGGRYSKAAKQLMEAWPAISGIMSKIGVKKFVETSAKFIKTPRDEVINSLRSTQKYATMGGTTVLAGSIVVPAYYSFVENGIDDIEK